MVAEFEFEKGFGNSDGREATSFSKRLMRAGRAEQLEISCSHAFSHVAVCLRQRERRPDQFVLFKSFPHSVQWLIDEVHHVSCWGPGRGDRDRSMITICISGCFRWSIKLE